MLTRRAYILRMAVTTSLRALRLLTVGLGGAVLAALALLGPSPTDPGSWAPTDALQVVRVSVDASGLPDEVALSWPASDVHADNYVVRRNNVVVATLPGGTTTYLDAAALGLGSYSVTAVSGGGTTGVLGVVDVRFPSTATECTLLWTGSRSNAWELQENWAPYGKAGLEGPVRAPQATDHTCVDVTRNLPITVAAAGSVTDRFTGTLFNPVTLRIAGGDLKVLGEATIPALQMAGGLLHLQGDAEFWTGSGRPPVSLGGGVLQLDGVATALNPTTGLTGGNVNVLAGTSTTLDGGVLRAGQLRMDTPGTHALVGRGGHRMEMTTIAQFEGDNTLTLGPGGATLFVPQGLNIDSGTTALDWRVETGPDDPLWIDAFGGTLELADLADLAPGDTEAWINLIVGGKVVFAENLTDLVGYLYVSDPDAVVLSGGRSRPFSGFEYINRLEVWEPATIVFDGDFYTGGMWLDPGADVTVPGELIVVTTGDGDLTTIHLNSASLHVGLPSRLPEDSYLNLRGAVHIYGDLTVAGIIDADGNDDIAFDVGATFHDDLTLEATTEFRVAAYGTGAAEYTHITVLGQLTLDGTLLVATPFLLPEGIDLHVVTTVVPPIGAFDSIQVLGDGNADGQLDIVIEDDGLHLTGGGGGGGGGDECAVVPQVNGMAVTGCWQKVPGEQHWITNGEIATKPEEVATIGGLRFRPAGGVTLHLELSDSLDPQLYARDADDLVGEIDISMLFIAPGDTVEEAPLGRQRMDWELNATPIDLDIESFLGAPTVADARLASPRSPWELSVAVRLPSLFGAEVLPFDLELPDGGLDGLRVTGRNLPFAELALLDDAVVTALGGDRWSVEALATPNSVVGAAAELAYEAGDLLGDSVVTMTDLSVAGFGTLDAVLEYSVAAGEWATHAVASDGSPVARVIETGTTLVGAGSRFVLGATDLALAATNEAFEIEKVVGGWAFDGVANFLGGSAPIDTLVPFHFHDGVPDSGEVRLGGSWGGFARFDDLRLAISDTPVPGLGRDSVAYDVVTTVVSKGEQVSTGLLALAGGAVEHLDLPMDVYLGHLGVLSGRLERLAEGFGFIGNGGPATFECTGPTGTVTVPAQGLFDLSGGVPTTGGVLLEAVCLGAWTLEAVELTFDPAVAGYELVAKVAEETVTGLWELQEGAFVKASIVLPDMEIGEWLTLPAPRLDFVDASGSDAFRLVGTPAIDALLQEFELQFTDGVLSVGEIQLGDAGPLAADLRDLVADAGEWLPVGGIDLTFDPRDGSWLVDAFLDHPAVNIGGSLVLADGNFVSGALQIDGADLGPLGVIDLGLAVDGPSSFQLAGEWQGPGFADNRSISGALQFADGELQAGVVEAEELPFSDLFVVDDFRLEYAGDAWGLEGVLRNDDTGTAIAGEMMFAEGQVTDLTIMMDDVPLGPLVVESLAFDLKAGDDEGVFRVDGVVRGPSEGPAGGGTAPLVEFAGGATLHDGELEAFDVLIPALELPGVAYFRDIEFSYDRSEQELTGAGTIQSADDTPSSAASLAVIMDDGRIASALVTAEHLSLGGVLAVDDVVVAYNATAPVVCAGATGRGNATYDFSGSTPAGAAVDGCLTFHGRDLVGADLDVERLEVGGLLVIDDLHATFDSTGTVSSRLAAQNGTPQGNVDLTLTRLTIDATVTAGELDPLTVSGQLDLLDGGVAAMYLEIGELPLSSTVSLHDLTMSYSQPSRWDGVSDTSFTLAGAAHHDGGVTTAAGALRFTADGALMEASLEVTALPLGPVTLDELQFRYEGGDVTSWLLAGSVTVPDGATFALSGTATLVDSRLMLASLDIPRLAVGEMVVLTEVKLDFERLADDSEVWSGDASVGGAEQGTDPATASFSVTIAADGSLSKGRIDVDHVSWGGLFRLEDLSFVGERTSPTRFAWAATARLAIGDGPTTTVSGSMVIENGRVLEGELHLRDLPVAELFMIDELDLVASTLGDATVWSVDLLVTVADTNAQVAASGSMDWLGGRLESAELHLADVPIAELFVLEEFTLEYTAGVRWAVSATVTDEDGTATAGGELRFTNGALSGGSLTLADFQFGPLDLDLLELDVDTTGAANTVCGVTDPGSAGIRFAFSATVGTGDGETSSLGGRLRLVDGKMVEGVLCGDDIQIADLVLLDDVHLAYALTGTGSNRTVSFDGTATVANPDEPSDTFSATVGFELRDGVLQRFDLEADGLNLGQALRLDDMELHFDRGEDATDWSFAGTATRPQGDTTIAGAVQLQDGVIVGGSLTVNDLRIGDLFTFTDLQLTYHSRGPVTDVSGTANQVQAGGTSDCAATPADSNRLVGPGGGTGGEVRFSVAATVQADDRTFAGSGAFRFANGKLTHLDVSVACIPLGDFKTLEGVRIAYRTDLFAVGARLQDDEGTSGVSGQLVFDEGRLSGGHLLINGLPLGVVQIDRFELALGENEVGDTEFGIAVEIEKEDGSIVGGGGFLTMRDGRVVAGSLEIAELPFLDLFTLRDLELTLDLSVPDQFHFAGGAEVVLGGGGSASMHVELTTENGRLVQGLFEASAVKLFDVIPLGAFSISYDSTVSPPAWSGSMEIAFGNGEGGAGPGLQIGAEFRRGKLVSGMLGFDVDGDGEVDGAGAGSADGAGDFAGFPLKALFIRYCAADAANAFCDPIDADTWTGRIGFELPTDTSPALDAEIVIRNGRFASASVTVSGLNIPIYPAVFLQSIGMAFSIDPRLEVGGQLGLTIGPGFTIVGVTGELSITEQPDPDPELPASAYVPEFLRIYTQGDANFFELPAGLTAWTQIDTNGSVGFGGGLQLDIIPSIMWVEGGVDGYLFIANGLGLTHPRTGQPLHGVGAQTSGYVAAVILGINIADAEFVANHIGAAGCAGIDLGFFEKRVGAGIYWSDGDTVLTCDMGRFKIAGLEQGDSLFGAQGTERVDGVLRLEAVPQVEFSTFDVAPGEELLGVEVEGVGGAPDVVLIAPDGTVYDADDNDPSDGTIVATGAGKRWFLVAMPQAGTWRVEASPSSLPLAEVAISHALPDVEVSGTVTAASGGFQVDWTAGVIPGQQIVFIERSLEADGYVGAVGGGNGPAGSFTFTPGGAATGGQRELVAEVWQDGFRRAEVVLGQFTAPNAVPAGAPLAVTVAEAPGGALVTWEPPADNGGREITSYRLASTAGWSVTTDAEVRSAFLPIPGLTVGETVPVFVYARTGLGWGAAATEFFTSTQVTGAQFAQPPRVESVAPAVADEVAPAVRGDSGCVAGQPDDHQPDRLRRVVLGAGHRLHRGRRGGDRLCHAVHRRGSGRRWFVSRGGGWCRRCRHRHGDRACWRGDRRGGQRQPCGSHRGVGGVRRGDLAALVGWPRPGAAIGRCRPLGGGGHVSAAHVLGWCCPGLRGVPAGARVVLPSRGDHRDVHGDGCHRGHHVRFVRRHRDAAASPRNRWWCDTGASGGRRVDGSRLAADRRQVRGGSARSRRRTVSRSGVMPSRVRWPLKARAAARAPVAEPSARWQRISTRRARSASSSMRAAVSAAASASSGSPLARRSSASRQPEW